MIFAQKPEGYEPICITLETKEEAQAFLSMIDKVDLAYCHSDPPGLVYEEMSKEEYAIIRVIANAVSEGLVKV